MFGVSERSKGLAERLTAFMARHIYPNEHRYFLEAERLGPWAIYPIIDELKPLARTEGLWNLTKAAVWLLSKSIALHCARQGWDLRCNSIHPAFIRTPILSDLMKDKDPDLVIEKLVKQVPLRRLGEPEEVAHAVVYLASNESRFMTGAELKLDGGISAM